MPQGSVQVLSPAGHRLGQPGIMVDPHRQVRISDPAAIILEEVSKLERSRVRAPLEDLEVQWQIGHDA